MGALIPFCYMQVPRAILNHKARCLAHVEKLVQSQTLHSSESLCKLLRYLAEQALEHPSTPPKEYQIATELFGRQPDFDPQLDSMVRVQAGRLRSKLVEYYSGEGAQDTLVVELPKGSYLLTFQTRTPSVSNAPGAAARERQRFSAAEEQFVSRRTFRLTVGTLSVLLLGSLVVLLISRGHPRNVVQARGMLEAPSGIATFWHGFHKGLEEPWVVFSNAAFVGRPDLGLRYYDPKRDGNAVTFDHYTGVGEVLAIHQLDTVFNEMAGKIRVKRGSLFSLDDAKNNDLIFIGSPSENLTLLEISGSQEFQFRTVSEGPRKGNVEIVNAHPQKGEAVEFLASRADVPLTEDYAVIALVHGLDPERSVLILAGTTTLGTQSAAEFVTGEDTVEGLLSRLSVRKPEELKPFEALIHVKIARGVPVGTELIAVRRSAP